MTNTPDGGDTAQARKIAGASATITLALGQLVVLAILQWLVFVFNGALENRVVGVVVLCVTGISFLIPMSPTKRLILLALIGLAGFANFVVHLAISADSSELRLLQVAVLVGYSSLSVASLASFAFRRKASGILLSALVVTLGLVAIEATLEFIVKFGAVRPNVVRWEGGPRPHPVLEESYPPHTVARTIYASNPRGYFTQSDPRAQRWRLGTNDPGSAARLLFPEPPDHDGVRVEIDKAEIPTTWHIQLTFEGLELSKGVRYQFSFKTRADSPRPFSYGISQAHPPWDNLGWYESTQIGTEWQVQEHVFRATATDSNARFTFDLGDDLAAVGIQSVKVEQLDTGASIVRDSVVEYSVSYQFNDLGCRGPDYARPKPSGVRRVLLLGDSYALGVGVHEQDTFSVQLQNILNGNPAKPRDIKYEVVNCGVSGYSTLQERKLLEIIGPQYAPDIVLVAMVMNDDSSWRSDVQNGYVHVRSKYEDLILLFKLVMYTLHEGRRPAADFHQSLVEVLAMQRLATGMGAKLVAFSFRNQPLWDGPWRALAETMSKGLEGSGIPWLDTGDLVVDDDDWHRLLVHPDGDFHPNEGVHRSAAEQIAGLLRDNGLLQ